MGLVVANNSTNEANKTRHDYLTPTLTSSHPRLKNLRKECRHSGGVFRTYGVWDTTDGVVGEGNSFHFLLAQGLGSASRIMLESISEQFSLVAEL